MIQWKILFLLQIFFLLKETNSVEQKCKFQYLGDWYKNGYSHPSATFYACIIKSTNILNESDPVIINTSNNYKSNDQVQLVWYSGGVLDIIPNSLFTTFVNLEHFSIGSNNRFREIKPHYFKNALKLKVAWFYKCAITKLGANLFEEAINLEHINFFENIIESVHRSTFSGLFRLKGVYFPGNNILSLHPETFSHLLSLQVLDLLGNKCINKKYESANWQFRTIEADLRRVCTLFPDELKNTEFKLTKAQIRTLKSNVPDSEDLIKDLTDKNKMLENSLQRMNAIFEAKFEQLSRILGAQIEQESKKNQENCLCKQELKSNADEMQKISDKLEKKSLENFAVLSTMIQYQKNNTMEEVSKSNKKDVKDLQNIMECVAKGFNKRIKNIESSQKKFLDTQ